jgi:predicted acylesterase/phospholipase RssA
MAHLGLLSVLLEHDFLPKVITGSSSGSLTTVLIGSNTLEELKALAKKDFR